MSFVDQSGRRSPASIAAVVGVHVAIGYALLSGLAYQVIKHPPHVTTVDFPVDQPPPPPPHPVEAQRTKLPAQPVPLQPQPEQDVLNRQPSDSSLPTFPGPGESLGDGGTQIPEPLQMKPNLARDAIAASDRLRWITTDDYPASALRQGIQGTVVISALIGTDSRVRSCVVVQSSGSQVLDDTTCRLYAKRAHFTPARDADGAAVQAQRTDRFRWQIPNE